MDGKSEGKHKGPERGSRLGVAVRAVVPLGLAVVVAVGVGGGVDLVHHVQRPDPEPQSASKPVKAGKGTKTAGPKGAEPRYVVGVRRTGGSLVVRDLRTGHDVGLPVAAPQGRRFQRVASEGDGSYVVAAATPGSGSSKVTFQRLTLEEDGHPKDLEAIPRVSVPGASTEWSDLAVGSDGDKIAYVTYSGTRSRMSVVSVETGARKTWTTKAPARISSLSWAGDTLSFVWNPLRTVAGKQVEKAHQVRTLDTSGAAGDLKVSRPILKLPEGSRAAVLSPDGMRIVTTVTDGRQVLVKSYYVTSGKPAEVLWEQKAEATVAHHEGPEVARLDPDPTGDHYLATGGDGRLFSESVGAVPAADLSDAAW
ncbi:hypothetical protein J4573_31260 [Actinomadura barringtoniae]|uniref:Uncharacterized protein n=1 Tax=Actinomadura barringtoniae TaxID=1427535 RepID=A0A939PN34_9ACTN|nr:hypothetical protein [Actinomadura barringtoniae]MBO2451606.1 hypothetical protein [Actinomadura barringtoniae]